MTAAIEASPRLVLQTNARGKYCSKLLHNRFQVLEGVLKGQYYICDHTLPDLQGLVLRQDDRDYKSEMLFFPSVEAAMEHINALVTGQRIKPSARVVAALAGGKRPATGKVSARNKAPSGPKKLSPAKMFHQLITETAKTDAEVYAEVKAAFPDMSYRATYPAWYRGWLAKQEK